MKTIHAAIGVIYNSKNKILITKRRPHQVYAGYWELPGGKIEESEDPAQTIIRELHEELDIIIQKTQFLDTITYQYPEFCVILEVFKILEFTGEIYGKEGQEIAWLDQNKLDQNELEQDDLDQDDLGDLGLKLITSNNLKQVSPLLPASSQVLDLLK